MTKAALADPTAARDLADYRRPSQKRSKDRFEAILDTAERLLETSDPSAISIHKIAAELGISAASIYHFFPEAPLVFAALAERYLRHFESSDPSADREFETWQEFQTHSFRAGRDYFNANVPARKVLLLGPAFSYDIRKQDLQSDLIMATRGIEQMRRHFIVPEIPGLIERSTEVIVISDALWALSILRHGAITEEMEEQARRARIAYARTYLPEYLPRRQATDSAQ